MLLFHVIDQLFFGGIHGVTAPTLIFTDSIATLGMMLHLIFSFKFSVASFAFKVRMRRVCLYVVAMNMGQSLKLLIANGAAVI